MRIIAKRPHIDGCFMLRDKQQLSPWCLDRDKPRAYADRGGGNRGSTTSWLRLRCNDPKCTALALIHEWDLMELAQKALK